MTKIFEEISDLIRIKGHVEEEEVAFQDDFKKEILKGIEQNLEASSLQEVMAANLELMNILSSNILDKVQSQIFKVVELRQHYFEQRIKTWRNRAKNYISSLEENKVVDAIQCEREMKNIMEELKSIQASYSKDIKNQISFVLNVILEYLQAD